MNTDQQKDKDFSWLINDHKQQAFEIERLRSLNAELVAALEYYASGIVGRGDIARAALAKVKERK